MNDGEYLDGRKHGPWITYYANGSKRSEGAYDRGVKEGPWVQYRQNGARMAVMRFDQGKYVGLYAAFHPNGNRMSEGYYTDAPGTGAHGTKEGPWRFYNEDGETVETIITYHHGSRSKPDEHPNPRIRSRGDTGSSDDGELV
jgi:antitoxin component YwqK of YwqJK toxin-antitoxin module